ncbi:uncharacterized protein DS421_5g162940 [Arachis hypogaea]|nr:uncharacterized protein DS421_5g162940 [Arachis hypogaea]
MVVFSFFLFFFFLFVCRETSFSSFYSSIFHTLGHRILQGYSVVCTIMTLC